MKSVLDVALYFLRCPDREAGDTISPLKLQKLVYYAQAWSMVFRNKPLFPETIEAWVHGPVVRDLWQQYESFRHTDIPEPSDPLPKFASDEEMILDEVWAVYGEKSAKILEMLTHNEMPWLKARKDLPPDVKSQEPILLEDMRNYYLNFVDTGFDLPRIQSKALQITKTVPISVAPISPLEEPAELETLENVVCKLQSLQSLRRSSTQITLAQQALSRLERRKDENTQDWASKLASDVCNALD